MKRLAFILWVAGWFAWGFSCAVVFGAWPRDSVCSISCGNAGGSGTLVARSKDGHGLVISARHVFVGESGPTTCYWPAVKQKCKARILGMSSINDIAALDVPNCPDIKLPAGIVAAKKSDGPFTAVGFPYYSRNEVRWTEGQFSNYENIGDKRSMFVSHQQVASGYSGGGRFNAHGQYVGPISGVVGEDGSHMDDTYGASGELMLAFVGKYMGKK